MKLWRAEAKSLGGQIEAVRAINSPDPIADGNGRYSSPLAVALFNVWADMDDTTSDYEAGERLAAAAMQVIERALANSP